MTCHYKNIQIEVAAAVLESNENTAQKYITFNLCTLERIKGRKITSHQINSKSEKQINGDDQEVKEKSSKLDLRITEH